MVIDCKMVAEKAINAAGNITIDGMEVLGRMVRSRGNKDNSAPVRTARTFIRIHTTLKRPHSHDRLHSVPVCSPSGIFLKADYDFPNVGVGP